MVAIEITDSDSVYAWEKIDGAIDFQKITLLRARDPRKCPRSLVIGQLRSTLDQVKPRVVVIPGWSEIWALAALNWCIQNAIPAILMSDSHLVDRPRAPYKEFVKSRVVRLFSSALVAGTPHIEYLRLLGLPVDRIFVGYDVIDNEHFAQGAEITRGKAAEFRREKRLPEKFFISCSRFVAEKNIPTLCRAYARYRQCTQSQAWSLVLVGDGPMRDTIKRAALQFGIADDLRLVGFKQYCDLPIYYALASAFLLASTREPWGLVVNEAMAAGLPVIVSNRCGCARDLVKDGINGFRVDPEDPDAIANAMVKLTSEQSLVNCMGNASRRLIKQWSPEFFAENLLLAEKAATASHRTRPGLIDRALITGLSYRRT